MLRLFKHKHLVEGLRSCIVRGGGGQNILTKELLSEIIHIAKSFHNNNNAEMLEDFYQKYVFEVLLD
jgi:hypothetical protein